MENDDLQKLWRAETQKLLERSERRVFRRFQASASLRRFSWLLAFEVLTGVFTAVLAGSFLGDHLSDPRLAVCGGILLATGIAQIVASARQLAMLARVEQSAPVLEAQQRLEALKVMRIRYLKTAFVVGLVSWVSFFVVGVAWAFGVGVHDALGWNWVLLNAAVGALLVPLFLWVSSKRTWFRRLREDLVGRSLVTALAQLEALKDFEREPT